MAAPHAVLALSPFGSDLVAMKRLAFAGRDRIDEAFRLFARRRS
jgi:hypothetical protein